MTARKKREPDPPVAARARKSRSRQRQRLIDACISALHLYGPSRTTVEKVVAIAKMSPGIVRFYFDSKAAMLVASLQFLAAEFEEQLLVPVAKLKSTPVAALELLVDLYLDPEIASPRKVSVWYAFWGEASSRQEYYDICGQKDESFAALVRELIQNLIVEAAQPHLDPDGAALGLIGALEILWQDFAFRTERDIDRAAAKRRCMAYLRSIFPGHFPASGVRAPAAAFTGPGRLAPWTYANAQAHALEREGLFQDCWTVVGHESQLVRAGDYLAVDIGIDRVLLVRDGAGAVHAMRNSCPEWPHTLVPGRCGRFAADIVCPLHGLRFSLTGRSADGGKTTDLQALAFSSSGGLMWVRRAVPGQPGAGAALPRAWLESESPPGAMVLEAPREITVAADWKVVVELWLESAAASLMQGHCPAPGSDSFGWPAAPNGAGWSRGRYLRLLQGNRQEWRRQYVAPHQLLETRPDGISVLQALPLAPGRSLVRRLDCTVLAPDDGARAALYLAHRLSPYARAATLELAASVQRGLIDFGYEPGVDPVSPVVGWFRTRLKQRLPALSLIRPPGDAP